jgi:hypothetical protein
MEEISQLHLSASQFVETFRRIDSTATILSGYEQPSLKKNMFKRVTSRGRLKSPVSDETIPKNDGYKATTSG